jgi:hypothetical protein
MKKQNVKKLALAKETLRDLDARALGDVDGGVLDPPLSLAPTCTTCWSLACHYTLHC